MLSGQFASSVDTPLVTLFFEAYSTCKVFLLETIPSLQEVWGQVITTLGHLASVLPEEQLDKELPWLVNEVERLQPQLPADMAFRLLTTLELCIKAAVTKSCRALNGTVPTVLAVLHHLICTPSSGVSDETEEPLKLSTAIILSLAHSHSSEVHKYFESSLMQIGAESRATTLQLLCKLLSETDSEGAFYLDAVRHVLEDDNRKVILATLSLMSSLTAKGFYDVNGRAVMDYVLKKTSLLIKEQGISHIDPESDVEEETIHIQIFQLLNKIALRHKNTDEGFWKEIVSYMLDDDYTSSVPALCHMLLVVDKKASINFHECAKEIPIHRLFIRLLVISSYPRWDVERGTSVLALLARLIPANYPFLAKLLRKKIPPLITYLEASTERNFDLAKWKCTLVSFLGTILKQAPYREWHVSFMEELTEQIDSFAHHVNEEGFIFQCLGKCMASCDDTALILPFLRSMFESTRFIATPYHAGIVIGFQTCAKVHPFACRQVLEAYKGCLSDIELDPDNLLEELPPPEYRDDFHIPKFSPEKHLEDMIKMMKSTLRLCEFILSK
ncbi:maestro heat-like repeat-containing protein family member 1 [Lissotriton helveticus]